MVCIFCSLTVGCATTVVASKSTPAYFSKNSSLLHILPSTLHAHSIPVSSGVGARVINSYLVLKKNNSLVCL